MKKINILIAEDQKEARDILVEQIEDFFEKNYPLEFDIAITKTESFQKAQQKIVESAQSKNYFDLFFCDIDFTEDNKGGKRDSGYTLIEQAFEKCPITEIVTYSGQFHATDLWEKYEELKSKGLILRSMDKSHVEGGHQTWWYKNLESIVQSLKARSLVRAVWENYVLIMEKYFTPGLKGNDIDKSYILLQMDSNFQSILALHKLAVTSDEKPILFRTIVYLHHQIVEQFCKLGKTEAEIMAQSDANRLNAQKETGYKSLDFSLGYSSQRIFVAYSAEQPVQFGLQLNAMRNRSIHPKPNQSIEIDKSNLLFALLTTSLYLTGECVIPHDSLRQFYAESDSNSSKDLEKLINYVNSSM